MRRLLTFLPLLATGFATAQTLRTEGVGWTPRFAYDAARPGVVALGQGTMLALRPNGFDRLPIEAPGFELRPLYLDHRRQLFAFCGAGIGYGSGTWSCDGLRWRELPIAGPSLRSNAPMCYDAARQEVVLFGGTGTAGYLQDTWVFDGSTWSQRQPTLVPPALSGASLAFDAGRSVTVLVGSQAGGLRTWEWNGIDWAAPPVPPLPNLVSHAGFAYLPTIGRLVLAGGSDVNGVQSHCFTYDGTAWTAAAPLPAPRVSHDLVFDPQSGRLLCLGGQPDHEVTDGFAFDGLSWSLAVPQPNRPFAGGAALAAEAGGTAVLLVGGQAGSGPGGTWRWDGATWTDLQVPSPVVPPGGMGVRDALAWQQLGQVHLFGGYETRRSGSGVPTTWYANVHARWNGASWSYHVGVTPPAVVGGALAFDAARGEAVLFGGGPMLRAVTAETWVFDGLVWQQRTPATSPAARRDARATYDPVRQRLVLFGGLDGQEQDLADTHEWDGSNWTSIPTAVQPPPGVLGFDSEAQVPVLVVRQPAPGGAHAYAYGSQQWVPLPLDAGFDAVVPELAILPPRVIQGFGHGFLMGTDSLLLRYRSAGSQLAAFGSACAADAPRLAANRWPDLGTAGFALELSLLPAGGFAALVGATQTANFTAFGCPVLVDTTQALVLLSASPAGTAALPLPLPAAPWLQGVPLFFQAATTSPVTPSGITTSRGLRVVLAQ